MNISVFCGSKLGSDPIFQDFAHQLGHWIGIENHTLIYGGASDGLMGVIADACISKGGNVIGVVPHELKFREHWHPHLTQMIEVTTMTERKQIFSDLADIYLALPGGPGTLEEIVDMISWSRVQLHHKPCILLNVNGYYNPLAQLFQQMVDLEFITKEELEKVSFLSSIEELITFCSTMAK